MKLEACRGSLHNRPDSSTLNLNQARLQSISLQKRPKPIHEACRFGVVGTSIPRSWNRCSSYSVSQSSFAVDAGSAVFR